MALTSDMKREIVEYLLTYSKGIIEDCHTVGDAYHVEAITTGEIEDFIDECKQKLLDDLKKT